MTTFEARQSRGLNLLTLTKMLRRAKLVDDVAGFYDDDRTLLRGYLVPTSWYPHDFFLRVLGVAHGALLGGGDTAAVAMGFAAGQAMLTGPHRIFRVDGDAVATAKNLARVWPSYFNFGRLTVREDGSDVEMTIMDYLEMGELHGNVLRGWAHGALSSCEPAVAPDERLVRAPWAGFAGAHGDFTLRLRVR